MNATLIFKQFTGHKKQKSMHLLIGLLDSRIHELSMQSKCAIIKSFHANGNVKKNIDVETFIGKLILNTHGQELTDLKNLLMAGGTIYNLQKLIFNDISDDLKLTILQHIKEEAALLTTQQQIKQTPKPIKVLSDIDDTIFCAVHDRRYPRNSVYPGVKALLDEIEIGSFIMQEENGEIKYENKNVDKLQCSILNCIKELGKRKSMIQENLLSDSKMKFAWDFDSSTNKIANDEHQSILDNSNNNEVLSPRSSVNVISSLDDAVFIEHANENVTLVDIENDGWADKGTIAKYKRKDAISREFSFDTVGKDVDINNVAFLTARPKGWRSLVTTLTRNRLNRSGVSKQATLLSGSFQNLFSSRQMAEKKFSNFCEYNDLFPEYDYVLLGDSGQGDAQLGLMALKGRISNGNNNVRGVFIHDINEGKDVTGDGELKQSYIDNGLIFHKNYVEAALKAVELNLIDHDAFARIAEAATTELVNLYYGESTRKRIKNVDRINELIKVLEGVSFEF